MLKEKEISPKLSNLILLQSLTTIGAVSVTLVRIPSVVVEKVNYSFMKACSFLSLFIYNYLYFVYILNLLAGNTVLVHCVCQLK